MSSPDSDRAAAEALARSIDSAIVERESLRMTIRPIDYLSVPPSAIPATRTGSFPSITLTEPTIVESPGEVSALEIVRQLGEGGMGRVLLARQRSLDREVAVKLLRTHSAGALAMALVHEGRVLGLVEHPNVIPVYALASDENGQPALVMKRIDGVAWSELVRAPDHPLWDEVQTISAERLNAHLEILMHVAQAVHFAHERGVLHRDIKTDNVIVGRHGEVYLADWGIAVRKADLAQEKNVRILGTPTHLAPEMARGDVCALDERTDVYLLGATLYEVLSGGRARHAGARLVEVLHAALLSAPPVFDDDVPKRFAEVCDRATRCDPAERYPSALAFREALAETLRHTGSIALTDAAKERQAELEKRVGENGSPERIYRLLSECRFAYAQALREWPENEDAKRRLAASIECVVRFEIGSARAGAARGLLSELEDPPAELHDSLVELESRERQDHERKRELERIAHDVDPTRAAAQYARLFAALGALVLALFVPIVFLTIQGVTFTPGNLIASSAVLLAAVVLGAVIFRRTLLDRQASRGVVGLLLGTFSAVFLERVVGYLYDAPVAQTVGANAVTAAGFALGAGLLVRRWFAWLSVPFLAAAFGGVLVPKLAVLFNTGSTVIVLAAAAAFWWRDRERES